MRKSKSMRCTEMLGSKKRMHGLSGFRAIHKWAVLLVGAALAAASLPVNLKIAEALVLLREVHVDPHSGSDTGSCGSTASPCKTLQHGVNRVAAGGIVKLARGTYTAPPGASSVLNVVFGPGESGKDFVVVGGFVPPHWDRPVPDPRLSRLDGEEQRRVVNIVSVPDLRISLENLTVERGFVNTPVDYTGEFNGGGIHCRSSNPNEPKFVQLTLRDVRVVGNKVQGYGNRAVAGGGISAYLRCWLVLERVLIADNEVIGGNAPDDSRGAQALGGGLFATMSSGVQGYGVWLLNNQVRAGNGGKGYLGNNTFDRADALGGGAAFQYNWVSLRDVYAENNEANAGSGSQFGGFGAGGGVFFEFSNATLQNVFISSNRVRGGNSSNRGGEGTGGGILAVDSHLTLKRARVVGNSATGGDGNSAGHGGGGGIYVTRSNADTVLHAENLVIAHNAARAGSGADRWGGGGGLYLQRASAYITHATFASNTVLSTMLAPAAISQGDNANMNLKHSIIAFHPSSGAAVLAHARGVVRAQNNLVWSNGAQTFGSWDGSVHESSTVSGNPKFASSHTLHIQSDSPAIDQAAGSTAQEDIDGQARPYGPQPDVGADEFVPVSRRAFIPVILR